MAAQQCEEVSERRREAALYEVEHPLASIVAAMNALDLLPGMHVLDVGCGAGVHLGLFAQRVAPNGSVIGLDIDPEPLGLAAELAADRIQAGAIMLEEGDLHHLPFAAARFDLVWSSMVLHHEEDPFPMLAEMQRVAKPGGVVAVLDGDSDGSFPCLPWPPDLEFQLRAAAQRATRERSREERANRIFGNVGRQLPRLLREAGLSDVRIHAFADVDQAPLDPARAAVLREWFQKWFGERVRDFLAPHDWNRYMELVDPASPSDLLASSDFFQSRTWYLATGRVPGTDL
jgi:ubiquinone/menaquinone biosynthesis C-methylase UbiE